ncbi:hypothetical protein ACGFJ7_13605 [Actinoplanes sp. NPDC048988]|uniref:hypothetical protein n=1 Tax=Actinoplanes sp. NPDC048988 TaxID=3363901 RepID=UPI00371BDFD4
MGRPQMLLVAFALIDAIGGAIPAAKTLDLGGHALPSLGAGAGFDSPRMGAPPTSGVPESCAALGSGVPRRDEVPDLDLT